MVGHGQHRGRWRHRGVASRRSRDRLIPPEEGDAVEVLDPKTGTVKRSLRAPFELEGLGWGRGDEHVRVVVWGRHGEVAVLDAASGRVVASHKNVRFHAFVLSPDGRFMGLHRSTRAPPCSTSASRTRSSTSRSPATICGQMAFHPREKRLAVTPGTRARIPWVIDPNQRATRGELPVMNISRARAARQRRGLLHLAGRRARVGPRDSPIRREDRRRAQPNGAAPRRRRTST